MTETEWPEKPEIFTEKVCQSLLQRKSPQCTLGAIRKRILVGTSSS